VKLQALDGPYLEKVVSSRGTISLASGFSPVNRDAKKETNRLNGFSSDGSEETVRNGSGIIRCFEQEVGLTSETIQNRER